jgi:prophage antirepressor-like protein
MSDNKENHIAIFRGKEIRKTIHNNEWWFVIADVVGILTDSVDPQGYIKDMRRRDEQLAEGWGQIATPLSIQTEGGMQKLNCANTEGVFRIIQSIPSPKAEPFKRWLAKVGYERIQEIEDPELATKRTRALYKAKGYSDFELIFSMLGERSTTEIHRNEDSKGFKKLKKDAKAGGRIAGNARRELEKKLGRSVVSKENYLQKTKSNKLTEKRP